MTEVQRAVGGMELFVQMPHAIMILEVNGDSGKARSTLNEIVRIKPEHKGSLGDADRMIILASLNQHIKTRSGNLRFAKRHTNCCCSMAMRRKEKW